MTHQGWDTCHVHPFGVDAGYGFATRLQRGAWRFIGCGTVGEALPVVHPLLPATQWPVTLFHGVSIHPHVVALLSGPCMLHMFIFSFLFGVYAFASCSVRTIHAPGLRSAIVPSIVAKLHLQEPAYRLCNAASVFPRIKLTSLTTRIVCPLKLSS